MNKDTYKLNACWCCSLTFIRVVAPKGAVCTVFVSSNIHRRILFSNSSFKRFNFTLLEQLNTNLHRISLHSSAKLFATWFLQPVTWTRIILPRARKYQDIRKYSRGKWPNVSLFFVTFTANLSIRLSNSCLAWSFSPAASFQTSW